MTSARARAGDERGSTSIELVILGPAFVLLLAMLVVGGRVAVAKQAIGNAASEAARSATLSRGEDAARQNAQRAADDYLAEQSLQCSGAPQVDLDLAAFRTEPGTRAEVTATVRCQVDVSGVEIPGLGSLTLEGSASSPLDAYRER
ncbi:hypothetical protein AWH69_03990 [Janibacter melonis]|uniref:TadE-like domain-containing protein n=1 Tax=Janibacter melonis TaxID=262209 RepID=A0A176QGJ5_9MICO|nr:TadE family protein [Janibacter melonis]OAB88937.1 hypothetical protein AWH69_03990 [Janibacter melonis]